MKNEALPGGFFRAQELYEIVADLLVAGYPDSAQSPGDDRRFEGGRRLRPASEITP